MSFDKSIDKELDDLTSVYQRGDGFGIPEAERELERRIDFLKHKQAHALNKKNNRIAALNLMLTALNIAILIYQIFFRQ